MDNIQAGGQTFCREVVHSSEVGKTIRRGGAKKQKVLHCREVVHSSECQCCTVLK